MARVVEERRPDTVIINDRDTEPRHSNTGALIAVIAIIVLLLIIFFAVRSFGGGGTTNINVPKPTGNVPNAGH
jgi:hypothetical protein